MRGALLAIALAGVVALAGCLAVPCEQGPPVSARLVASDAPDVAGAGGHQLRIQVTSEPGGPPLPGAGVVVYWGDERGEQGATIQAGPGGLIVEPGAVAWTPAPREVLALRTDATGAAVANVPAATVVGVVAAAPGHTEEYVARLASGGDGRASDWQVPLYAATRSVTIDGSWRPGGASTAAATGSAPMWEPRALDLGPHTDAYLARLVGVEATLEWQNAPTAFGDLGLALGTGQTVRAVSDESQDVDLGGRTERLGLGLQELLEAGVVGEAGLAAGPSADVAYVAPFGLPYTVTADLTFDRFAAQEASCWGTASLDSGHGAGVQASAPAVGLLALLGLLALAAVARRQRQP